MSVKLDVVYYNNAGLILNRLQLKILPCQTDFVILVNLSA
jgi:hypothetical protein